jgi:putative SOS response-associated peptidase YedK
MTGEYHNRMPVILKREDEAEWLDPVETDPMPLERLLRPYPAEEMAARAVSPAVNNVRNNNESLIAPIEDSE